MVREDLSKGVIFKLEIWITKGDRQARVTRKNISERENYKLKGHKLGVSMECLKN